MKAPIRLAILEADIPLAALKDKYGTFGDFFRTLLDAAATGMDRPELSPISGNGSLDASKWDVYEKMEYPNIDEVDALLITGSKHDAFEDIPWVNRLVEYTEAALATKRVKVIGVCFGHQILGRTLGVKVGRNESTWEVAVNDVELTTKGKELFRKDKLSIHQMHKDIVYTYPPGAIELGSSPVCKVQGMYSPNSYISVQGHPEFQRDIMEILVTARHSQGIFDDIQYKEGMQKAALDHDGVVVAQAFLRFLLEG